MQMAFRLLQVSNYLSCAPGKKCPACVAEAQEKAKANVAKEEVEKKNKALNMAVNILLGIILLIGLDSLYRYIDLSSQMRMQEGKSNFLAIFLTIYQRWKIWTGFRWTDFSATIWHAAT